MLGALLADLRKKRPALRYALPAAIAAAIAIVALDQVSKELVVDGLDLRNRLRIDVFPGLSFHMAWNDGINFGLLSGGGEVARTIFALGTSLVALALVLGSLTCRRMVSAIGLGVAAGGAIGNTIDRLIEGRVADFINVSCCGISNPWSFNVADIAVFVGFGLLLLPLRQRPAETPVA